ncbi:MAG: hypothetical protein Q4G05_05900, partial [Clostridia bacterium]|nr:hypothetical protein [Clostridia bacterium]
MDNTYIESLFDFTLEENVDFATFAFKRLIITEEILAYYKLAKPLIHLYNNSKKSPITKIISDDFFIETYNTLKLISKDKYSYNKFLLLFWTMINYNEYNTLNLETNELIINFNYVPEPGNLINLYLHASSFFNKIISNLTLKSGELSTYTYESLVYDFFNTSDVKTFYSKVFKSKLFYNRIDIWETFSLKFPIITKKRTFHLEETSHNLFNSM